MDNPVAVLRLQNDYISSPSLAVTKNTGISAAYFITALLVMCVSIWKYTA